MFKNTNSKKMTGILLALVLVTSLFIGGSIARYVTSTSSEDEARVAVWGINEAGTTMDLFQNEYKLEDDTLVAKSNDGDNIIAPGLNGASQFKIVEANANLNPEVMYEVKISLDDSEIADEIKNHPSIQWKVDNGEWVTWNEFKEELLMLSGDASGVKTYAPGTVAPEFANGKRHTVAWQWIMDSGYDVEDTAMGNLSADGQDITAKLIITVTAQQTDIDSTGMLEGNGSVYDINNPTPLVFRSAAPLNELQSVKIGDTTLTKNTDYTATSGSTVITLNESYLSTLEKGNYVVSIISTNMTAKAKFKVKQDINLDFQEETIPEGGVYYVKVPFNEWDYNALKDYTDYEQKLVAGDSFPQPQAGDVYIYDGYEYRYHRAIDGALASDPDNGSYEWYDGGDCWGVAVLDKSKTQYPPVLSTIGNKPVTDLTALFANCSNLTTPPVLSTNTTNLFLAFSHCTNLETAPIIPQPTTDLECTFSNCHSLTTAPIIPENVEIISGAFYNCTNLVGTIEINANLDLETYEEFAYGSALYGTQITEVIGSTPYKTEILETKNQEF